MTESGLKRLVALTSAAALAGALWIVARTFLFPTAPARPPSSPVAVKQEAPLPTKSTTPTELTRTILANDIFGLKPLPGSQEKSKEPPKPAEIDMELAGTIVSTDGRHSSAFLRDKSTKIQKSYAVGATVKDARIQQIGKNFVILERQGREEILSMKP
ncbi:type II secretion system protein N [Desulfovibrio sp. TomC]|uniref:type II secretion system protein N n=1 Tax=Desulfovibrio sp. TomC TaxID=1562888 RepID=UPI0005752AEA|nr:type II secretion system protein N [Desulfovibrio sp. TomC]KHK01162.1 hypothetical protein NY78_3355 [Desulfovibrio sp. TomC]